MVPCSHNLLEEDVDLISYPHTDDLVIEHPRLDHWKGLGRHRSSADIIFSSTFDHMNIDKNLLRRADIPLIRFRGKRVNALGKISLPITFGNTLNPRTEYVTFDVEEMNYPYLPIFGLLRN